MVLDEIDLKLLLVFEAVFDARSVSLAARRLGTRQPLVSAALGRLRVTLQDELFVRAAGAMQPTAKAHRIAPGIALVLKQLRETLADAAPFTPRVAERAFTLASTDYTTLVLLPGIVAAMKDEAPGVTLRIFGYDKGDVGDLIDRGEIDLALGVFRDPPGRAVAQTLCPERFVGLARRDHPLLSAGRMSAEAYAAQDHALVSVRRDATGEIDAVLGRLGLSRRVALTLPHMLALPGILAVSDLVAAVPSRAATAMAGDALAIFELPFELPGWRIEMLWNPTARSDKASAWFRSTIVGVARGLPATATRALSPPDRPAPGTSRGSPRPRGPAAPDAGSGRNPAKSGRRRRR